MYSAEIRRKNPGCFIFLLDQSASMEDPFGGSSDRRKADELATIINKLIHNLSIRCAKGDSIYDYFHVAVIGYGQDTVVKSAFDGPLTGKDLIPISDLQQPAAHRGSHQEGRRRRGRPGGADGEIPALVRAQARGRYADELRLQDGR